MRQMQKKTER